MTEANTHTDRDSGEYGNLEDIMRRRRSVRNWLVGESGNPQSP